MELSAECLVNEWCEQTTATLKKHRRVLSRIRSGGAHLTLYVSTSGSAYNFRLEPPFIRFLASLEVALEHDYLD